MANGDVLYKKWKLSPRSDPTKTEQNIEWTRSNTQQFIEVLKKHPCVWQKRNKNYRNKAMRRISLNAVTKQLMGTMNCLLTPEMIMKKLHTLRGQYRREVREIKTSQKSGADTDDLYQPRLWCYDALAFLDAKHTPLDSTSNLDEPMIAQVGQ